MSGRDIRSDGRARPGGTGPRGPTAGPAADGRSAPAPGAGDAVVARLVPRALGVALGTVGGGALFLLAMFHACLDLHHENALIVWLLGDNFLPGYSPTAGGALAGLLWGFVHGFTLGWAVAWARNAFLGTWVQMIARRERLRADGRVLEDLL